MPGDTSISFISCAGRQKCMPTTRSSRPEPPAISVIDSVEVLEAKIVSAGQIAFELAEQLPLDGKLLEHRLDDEIGSRQVRPATVVRDSRAITASLSAALILPRSTDLAKNAVGLLQRAVKRFGCATS